MRADPLSKATQAMHPRFARTETRGRRTCVLICAFVAALVLVSQQALAQQRDSVFLLRTVARIDSLARAQLAIDGTGGMTIGLVTDSGLVWTRSYGFADMKRHELASRETVYRIGSITKQFTAVMLLQLVQRGVVRLSDHADQYFPALDSVRSANGSASRITLMQLATMTSGLAQEPDDEARYSQGWLADWRRTLGLALQHTTLNADPGATWDYSNVGYASLGAALERAAGIPYMEYVRARILEPLGMAHTAFALDSAMRRRLATGYAFMHDTIDTLTPRRELLGRGYRVPNGGLFSTVDDLAAFLRFEMGNGPDNVVLRTVLKRHFATVSYATADLKSGYGLGFHAVRHGSIVALGHPGSVPGYLTAAYFDPATHTGVIVLRNVDDQHFDVLEFCLTLLEIAAESRK